MKWKNLHKLNKAEVAFVANLARWYRCGPVLHSWRAVARELDKRLNGDWEENQMAGADLCQIGAEFFKEDPSEYPWN